MTNVVKSWISEWAAVAFTGTRTLVSLADNEWTHLSDEINNAAGGAKAVFADFHLTLGSLTPTGTDAAIELYLLPIGTGDVYSDWTGDGITDLQEHNVHFIGSFTVSTGASIKEQYLRDVEIPPGKYELGVRNRTNVALAASGSSLNYRLWTHGSA